MCRSLEHRGPDDERYHVERGLAMGVRRLAVVDIAGGGQPLSNERGDVWVSFNGELYEHERLLDGLAARGHRLATSCDTEVWPHLYEERGDRMWSAARGQFAVAVWDRGRGVLLLGRDRFGICPLYYTQADGWLLWGSEVRALLASGLVTARPDLRGINHHFCFCSSPPRRTCFEGVSSLPPGHYLRVENGQVELRMYWQLDFPDRGSELPSSSLDALSDRLEEALAGAVRRRLRGDVPVAAFLSGGVDSSLVLALACRESGRPVPAFTIALTGSRRDESRRASRSARLCGSPMTTLAMTRRDIAAEFPRLVMVTEAPVVDATCACIARLAAEVCAQGFKVVLTGEGADEALAGYPWYYLQAMRPASTIALRALGPLLGGRRILVSRKNGKRVRASRFGFGKVRTVQQDYLEVVARSRETLFSDWMWDQLDGVNPLEELDIPEDRMRRWHPLNQAIFVDYRTFLPGLLLSSKGDRSAMASSVETRPPFLDEDVVELCASLPPETKMRHLTEKWLLRTVAERILPREVAWRRKLGFHTEFSGTFLGPDRPPWVDQLLSEESIRTTCYFDPAAVRRQRLLLAGAAVRLSPGFSSDLGLTNVIATQLWHHTFCGGGLADLPTFGPPKGVGDAEEPVRSRRRDG